jgi:hypothetical protein
MAPNRIEWQFCAPKRGYPRFWCSWTLRSTRRRARRPAVMSLRHKGPWGIIFFAGNLAGDAGDGAQGAQSRDRTSTAVHEPPCIRDEFVDTYAVVSYWDGKKWLRAARFD